jgi:hypothetical protein
MRWARVGPMLDFLRLFAHVLSAPFRTQAQLEAEITMLRHQLNVLCRQAPSKPRLTAADRLLFVWLCRLFPSLRAPSRSCSRTLYRAGIGRAFGSIGGGGRGRAAVGPRYRSRFGA